MERYKSRQLDQPLLTNVWHLGKISFAFCSHVKRILLAVCVCFLWTTCFAPVTLGQARNVELDTFNTISTSYKAAFPNPKFKRYTTEAGLSNNHVTAILQDANNFIWIGTANGLNQFDGVSFKHYFSSGDPDGFMQSNYITCLLEDRKERIWIGYRDGGLTLFDPKTENHTHHFPCLPRSDTCALTSGWISQIFEDKYGNFWCAMKKHGIFRFSPDLSKVDNYTVKNGLLHNFVRSFCEDPLGRIWIGTEAGINIYHHDSQTFDVLTHDPNDPHSLSSKFIWSIVRDSQENMWVGTAGVAPGSVESNANLNLYIPEINGFKRFNINTSDHNFDDQSKRIFQIKPLPNGDLWLAGHGGGITYYSKIENRFMSWLHDDQDPNSVGLGMVYAVTTDRTDGLWVGTSRGGLCYYHPGFGSFNTISDESDNHLPFGKVTNVQEDAQQRLWVGSEDGLFLQSDEGWKKILSGWVRGSMLIAKNNKLYVWYWPNQLQFLEIDINTWEINKLENIHKGGTVATHMIEDNQGNLIIFNGSNILSFSTSTRQSSIVQVSNDTENHLENGAESVFLGADIDRNNDILWLMDAQQGLVKGSILYTDSSMTINVIQTISFDIKKARPGKYPQTQNVLYDPENKVVWATSRNGLYLVNEKSGDFELFNRKDGLIDEHLAAIQKDLNGNLIIIHSNNYVSIFDMNKRKFSHRRTVMPANLPAAIRGRTIRRADGSIVSIRQNSLITFNPSKWSIYPDNQPLYITGFDLFSDQQDTQRHMLNESIKYTKQINLKYDQNFWSINYTVVDFIEPTEYSFAYRLKGLESEFNYVGNKREAVYTNISPGTYSFQLKATKDISAWDEAEYVTLQIVVSPPWWATWWARTLYGLIVIFLAFYLYKFLLNRQHEKQESLRLQQVDELKTKLYTNVTHEFRSPLTVILGMVDKISDYFDQQDKTQFTEGQRLIRRSGTRLLNLVNQMLDLSKIDAGYTEFNFKQHNIIQYINYIVESFHSLAGDKSIELITEHESNETLMDYDENVIQKIVSNLLSNAIHFSIAHSEIIIKTLTTDNHFQISIQDFGQGISSDDLPRVFDRFYQVDKISRAGTGVGLALTKELTLRLDGQIWVESKLDAGSIFFVLLPITNNALFTDQSTVSNLPMEQPLTLQLAGGSEDMPMVLVIEDNREVAFYIGKCLESNYQLEYAEDGQAGIEKAIELIPDFIISDVMMPKKSGFQVTETLKHDQRTSHIPIILLTAKAGLDSKLKGLKKGADAYLTKPFNKEELLVRIEHLIELRRQLRKKYANLEFVPSTDTTHVHQQEDEFILLLRDLILNDSSDDLSVNDICLQVGMSRSQLHRKLAALTNQSTTQFIRSVRFQKAKNLLKSTKLTIAEIAYDTGFKTPSYFSRMFTKEEGMSPTEYREKNLS